MKLQRDLGITQKTAWMIGQKIRDAWADQGKPLTGTVEDETYICTDGAGSAGHGWQAADVAGVDSVSAAKRGRGRPAKYKIEPINAPADEIVKAIFNYADRKKSKGKSDDPEIETV